MPRETLVIELSGREAALILKYGYPFPDQAKLFEPIAGRDGWFEVRIGRYWLELIVGDLSRSVKELDNYGLQEEIDGLCCSLELALGRG